jgi:hypothetical protein
MMRYVSLFFAPKVLYSFEKTGKTEEKISTKIHIFSTVST